MKKQKETIICASAELEGNVIFGQGCIVHPHCSIIAKGGPIYIGDFNIIEERVTIVNKGVTRKREGTGDPKAMYIGDYNLFEVGAIIDSSDIAYVKKDSVVKDNCIVTVCAAAGPAAIVPSYTIVLENGNVVQRPDPSERHLRTNIECIFCERYKENDSVARYVGKFASKV